MKRFNSTISITIVTFLALVAGGLSILLIMNNAWGGWSVIVVALFFVAHTFSTTFYIVDGKNLHIRCGFLFRNTIEIASIKKLKETKNRLSSPAASFDRLAIYYGNDGLVLVSPNRKREFIRELSSINPNIEVWFKNKG